MKDQNIYVHHDNGSYEPIGLQVKYDYLPDGIYYVRHNEYSRDSTNVDYMAGCYRIGDSEKINITIPQICGLEDLVDEVTEHQDYRALLQDPQGYCRQDLVRVITKIIYNKSRTQE